jgi:hypothetical protein
MGKFINHEAASDFMNRIEDPLLQNMVRYAYQTLCMSDAVVEGEFDLFFFFRIMEEFLRDREAVAKALMGDFGENKTGWGE